MPLENYQVISKLGSGKYASVYKIRRITDDKYFAMKRLMFNQMSPKEKANSLSEIKLLTSIQHPNIVNLIQVFYDQFIQCLCLILELAQEGDLSNWISQKIEKKSTFSQEQIWRIIDHINQGLQFLHLHSIIHRDIKPSNILVFKNGVLKIGDFNISKINDGLYHTRTGTFTCASPEIWKGQRYDCKTDIWSYGCLIYELICLQKPFQGQNIEEIYKKICKCQYTKINNDNYSKELKDLVNLMIQINPKLRPSASTLCKMTKNKKYKGKQHKIVTSFNLSNIAIPGLCLTPLARQPHLILESSVLAESNIFKKSSASRNKHLSPIPTIIKTIGKAVQPEIRQVKSRYNCKIIHRNLSYQIEDQSINPPTNLVGKEVQTNIIKNHSNLVIKRSIKTNKLKVIRRHTQI